ncbi:hypothetical protein M3J09_003062 [Ascochyta lentis]
MSRAPLAKTIDEDCDVQRISRHKKKRSHYHPTPKTPYTTHAEKNEPPPSPTRTRLRQGRTTHRAPHTHSSPGTSYSNLDSTSATALRTNDHHAIYSTSSSTTYLPPCTGRNHVYRMLRSPRGCWNGY